MINLNALPLHQRLLAAQTLNAILDQLEQQLATIEIRRARLQADIDGIAIQQPAVATNPGRRGDDIDQLISGP